MKLLSHCTCTGLTEGREPRGVKSAFTELDEVVVVWAKVAEVPIHTKLRMDWFSPNKQRLITVTIEVEATTDQIPFRYAWSYLKVPLVRHIDQGFGLWEVVLQPFDQACQFRLIDVSPGYRTNGSGPVTSLVLNKVY